MINPQGLELPMSRINFYGPNDVRATEVLLYMQNTNMHCKALSMYSTLSVTR